MASLIAPVFPGPLAPPESLEEFDRLYAEFLSLSGAEPGILWTEKPAKTHRTEPALSVTLDPAQLRRVQALHEARNVLVSVGFLQSSAPKPGHLITVADFILEG